MAIAYLGFGSNKGNKSWNIETAHRLILKLPGTKILKRSSIYETEPWGKESNENYFNSTAMIETGLKADELLRSLKAIEKEAGRTETERWADREIDIDLLFYENDIYENEFMKVPHHEIENRKFVLIPMNEIAPDFIHPVLKKSMSELLAETKDTLKVNKLQFAKSTEH